MMNNAAIDAPQNHQSHFARPQVTTFPAKNIITIMPIVQNAIYPWRRVMAAEPSTW